MKRFLLLLLCCLPLMAETATATFQPAAADDGFVTASGAPLVPSTTFANSATDDYVAFNNLSGFSSNYETLFRFDTSSLSGKTIQSASLTVRVTGSYMTSTGCHFSMGWWSGPADYTFWSNDDFQDAYAETAVGPLFGTVGTTVTLPLINLGSINKTGYTGIRLKVQNSSCSFSQVTVGLASVRNANASYRPYLTVTYINGGAKLIILNEQ